MCPRGALAALDEADAHGLSIVANNIREIGATFPPPLA
jgi:hypothetical protein